MSDDVATFKGRQFICACGKNYLSYAALFTHIKQKHDGQPPGPITRPRSQRKRGRPRKNPQGDNQVSNQQESQRDQNDILKIQPNNNIQKHHDHQKTKKAAQQLGCGGFVAFTAYRPEPIRSSPKKVFQSVRKSMSRKGSAYNQLGERKISTSLNPFQDQPNIASNSKKINQQHEICSQNFFKKLYQKNNNQLSKIFTNHPQNSKNWTIKSQQLQIFKKINVNYENPQQIKNIQQVSINIGIALFINQIKKLLNKKQHTYKDKLKIQQQYHELIDQNQAQNWNITHKQTYDYYQFDQVLLLIAFLLKYIVQIGPDGINQLQAKPIFEIVQYLPKFTTQYLHEQIKQYQLQNFDLFKQLNPVKFIIYLNNWLAIKKSLYQLNIITNIYRNGVKNQINIKQEQKQDKYQGNSHQQKNIQKNREKDQDQDEDKDKIDNQLYRKIFTTKLQQIMADNKNKEQLLKDSKDQVKKVQENYMGFQEEEI